MKQKVLIVEDEVLIAESYVDQLQAIGLRNVQIANTPEQARIFFETQTFDLVLMDLRLRTHFEGIELAALLKQTTETPLIFLTAHSDRSTLEKMLKHKPAAFLSKPIRRSELHSAVLIALKNTTSEVEQEDFVILGGNTKVKFNKCDFLYAESSGNYIQVFIENRKREVIRMTLDQLVDELESDRVMRINRSAVVNLKKITSIKGKDIWIDEKKLGVSPSKLEEFQDLLTTS